MRANVLLVAALLSVVPAVRADVVTASFEGRVLSVTHQGTPVVTDFKVGDPLTANFSFDPASSVIQPGNGSDPTTTHYLCSPTNAIEVSINGFFFRAYHDTKYDGAPVCKDIVALTSNDYLGFGAVTPTDSFLLLTASPEVGSPLWESFTNYPAPAGVGVTASIYADDPDGGREDSLLKSSALPSDLSALSRSDIAAVLTFATSPTNKTTVRVLFRSQTLANSLTVSAGRDGRAQLKKKSVSYTLTGGVYPRLTDLPNTTVSWKVKRGPGPVTFASPRELSTKATFRKPGKYELQLSVSSLGITVTDTLIIQVKKKR